VSLYSPAATKQEFEQRRREWKIRSAPEPMAHSRDHFRDRQCLRIGGNVRAPHYDEEFLKQDAMGTDHSHAPH
jgi:hypothetical protein